MAYGRIPQARTPNEQVTGYLRKQVAYHDGGVSEGVYLGTLPEGAMIVRLVVNVTEAFDAGTTNSLFVGTEADENAFLEAQDIDIESTGIFIVDRPEGMVMAARTPVVATLDMTGTAATAGAVDVLISYVTNGG